MFVERNLIISILKLTKSGPIDYEIVRKDARIPKSSLTNLLKKMQNEGLLYLCQDKILAVGNSRLKLAYRALALGADIQRVSNLLCWQEFEKITVIALEKHGYSVKRNLRFKQRERRWELDVVGFSRPIVLCIDCKDWHCRISVAALKKIVQAQLERTQALADSVPQISVNLDCNAWKQTKFFPVVLSLQSNEFKFYKKVPVVSVFQLQDFLFELPAYIDFLKHFTRNSQYLGSC